MTMIMMGLMKTTRTIENDNHTELCDPVMSIACMCRKIRPASMPTSVCLFQHAGMD